MMGYSEVYQGRNLLCVCVEDTLSYNVIIYNYSKDRFISHVYKTSTEQTVNKLIE